MKRDSNKPTSHNPERETDENDESDENYDFDEERASNGRASDSTTLHPFLFFFSTTKCYVPDSDLGGEGFGAGGPGGVGEGVSGGKGKGGRGGIGKVLAGILHLEISH